MDAALAPTVVGRKVTFTEQDDPGTTGAEQPLLTEYDPGSAPDSDAPLTRRSAFPVLDTVIDSGELAATMTWSGNDRLAGDTLICGALEPPPPHEARNINEAKRLNPDIR